MQINIPNSPLLSREQQKHIEEVIEVFARRAYLKYLKGQQEHGGDLWKKDIVLPELINETLDFVVYAFTLEQQIKEAKIKLGENLPDVSDLPTGILSQNEDS